MRKSTIARIAQLGLVGVPMLLLAADWPQFRGPHGTAVSSEKGLPIKWSAKENIRWKTDLPGRGLTNPVIGGDRVFVTASSGVNQDRLHVLCFTLADGKKLWERQFWGTGSTTCHPKTCMAAPTPTTDGESVFALFATGDLAALDKDGNLLWYRALVKDYPNITNNVGMAASPILYKDILILPMENAVDSVALGVDKKTGQNRWKIERTRDINWVTPTIRAVDGKAEVLFQSGKELTAVDPETGKQRWTYQSQGLSSITSPVIADANTVVINGAAVRPSQKEEQAEMLWEAAKLKSGYSSPVCLGDKVYVINPAGVLTCAKVGDGKVLWQERLKGPFSASPVYADGKIYAVSEDGTTTVVDVTAEQPKTVASNPLGETMLATPAIADGAIFLRSDQHLFCIGPKK